MNEHSESTKTEADFLDSHCNGIVRFSNPLTLDFTGQTDDRQTKPTLIPDISCT